VATVAKPPGAAEEAVLGKAYDVTLLRRLWPFVRPHWRLLLAWSLFVPITIAFELAQPAVFQWALTEHMRHGKRCGSRSSITWSRSAPRSSTGFPSGG
jgi:hypothetical protein